MTIMKSRVTWVVFFVTAICLMLSGFVPVQSSDSTETRFADIEIEEDYRDLLLANHIFMELTGVKVIEKNDGTRIVISIAMTDIRDDSAKDKLRRMKVGRSKALAGLMQHDTEIKVWTYTKMTDHTILTIDDGEEHGKNLMEILDVTQTKAEGFVRDMPIIGTWKSKDRSLYYLALGKTYQPNE